MFDVNTGNTQILPYDVSEDYQVASGGVDGLLVLKTDLAHISEAVERPRLSSWQGVARGQPGAWPFAVSAATPVPAAPACQKGQRLCSQRRR